MQPHPELHCNVTIWFFKSTPIATALILLSLITGFSQIKTEGLAWQEANYWPRLEAAALGNASAPDQHRILSDRFVVFAVRTMAALGIPRPVGLTFVSLRILQNLVLFGLAFAFYRKLGIHAYPATLGLSALAWGMTQSNYGADLGFSAYTDIILYIGAAIALLYERPGWLIPIAAIAVLNRESSILIPYMGIAAGVRFTPRMTLDRTIAMPGFAALAVWTLLFAVLHFVVGSRPWSLHESGAAPGLPLWQYNLTHGDTWGHAVGALGLIPALALISWRGWHPLLRPLFWSVAPAWCLAHLFVAPLDQSRALLLPQILIFIPGLLCGLTFWRHRREERLPGLLA